MHKSLARSISLWSAAERRMALKQARTILRSESLDIRAMPAHGMGKILIIAPRKIGSAPQRNLLKRRLKALFYEEKLFELGMHIIVYLKKPSATLSYTCLKEIIVKAMGKHP